jgi:hypothetical protein
MANNTAIALSGKFSDCLTATPTPTNIMALEKSQVVPRSQLARDDLRSELRPKNQYKMKHPAPMNNHVINSYVPHPAKSIRFGFEAVVKFVGVGMYH